MAREKKDAMNFGCKFEREIFEKLEELFHKYNIAPDRYAVTFLPGINDYEKTELYVMNNHIQTKMTIQNISPV